MREKGKSILVNSPIVKIRCVTVARVLMLLVRFGEWGWLNSTARPGYVVTV
jgi:hypothetical protein